MKPHSLTNRVLALLTGLFLFLPASVLAERRDLTAQELKAMIDSGRDMVLLNSLSDIEFNEGHIPGSINIPLHMIMKTDKLPKRKDVPIVTYCLSDKWVYYREAAGLAANCMYTTIDTFSGGMKAWEAAGYPIVKADPLPDYAVETIDASTFKADFDDFCVVDIRMRNLYATGMYTKHLNEQMQALSSEHRKRYIHKIPLPHLSERYKKVPMDKKIVVVDFKGKQAPLAARFLMHKGYPNVSMLDGGLMSFEK